MSLRREQPPRLRGLWSYARNRPEFSQAIGAAFGIQISLVISGILVARMLGVTSRGHLALLTLMPIMISQLGSLGLPAAATFFVARDYQNRRRVVHALVRPAVTQAVGLTLVHGAIVWRLVSGQPTGVQVAGWLTLIGTPAILGQQYGLAILQGQQRFGIFNVLRVVTPAIYAAGGVALASAHRGGIVPVAVIWTVSYVSVSLAALLAVTLHLRSAPLGERVELRPLVKYGVQSLLGWVSPVEGLKLDQAAVGLMLSPKALGLYVVGLSFTNFPRFIAQGIGMIGVAQVAAEPDTRGARRALKRFVSLGTGLSLAVVVILGLGSGRLVPLLFGAQFRDAVTVSRLLLISAFLMCVRRLLSDGARGLNRPFAGSAGEIASWAVLLPGVLVLGPRYGIAGVALALIASSAASLAVVALSLTRGESLRMPALARVRPAGAYLAVGIALAAAGRGIAALSAVSTGALLVAGIALVAWGPVVIRIVTGSFDPFEPIVVFAFMWTLMFVLRPATMLAGGDFSFAPWPSHVIDLRPTFNFALVLALLGALAFVAGYALPAGRNLALRARPPGAPSPRRIVTLSTAAAALGTALFALFLLRNGRGAALNTLLAGRSSTLYGDVANATNYAWQGAWLLVPASLCLFAVAKVRRSFAVLVLALAVSGVLLLRTIPTGQRIMLIPFAGGLIVLHYVFKGTRPRLWTTLGATFAALVLSAVLVSHRTSNSGAVPFTASLGQLVTHPADVLLPIEKSGDGNQFPGFAAVLQVVPSQLPHTYGRTFLEDVISRPIPRKLWPSKPLEPRQLLIRALWPREYAQGIANPEFSAMSVMYFEFGALGVIMGMALYGAVSRALWEYFRRYSGRLGAQVLFALALTSMIAGFRDDGNEMIVRLVLVLGPVFLIFGRNRLVRGHALAGTGIRLDGSPAVQSRS